MENKKQIISDIIGKPIQQYHTSLPRSEFERLRRDCAFVGAKRCSTKALLKIKQKHITRIEEFASGNLSENLFVQSKMLIESINKELQDRGVA